MNRVYGMTNGERARPKVKGGFAPSYRLFTSVERLLMDRGFSIMPYMTGHVEDVYNQIFTMHGTTMVLRVDDVRERAGVLGVELSLDERRQVLQRIHHAHDANIGICWDVIDNHIEDFVRERWEQSDDSRES